MASKFKVSSPIKVSVSIGDILTRFNDAFEEVSKHVIGREDEITAIKYGLLCGGNILFEGPAGIAKSLLVRLCFKAITSGPKEDLVVFRKMFMPGTTPDELFGPMSIRDLREKDTIRFETSGMLPCAHLAYLDELFRGGDSLLESTMGILNEKTFHNGKFEQKCPLISAVATTNFVSDDPRLQAFNDRWLITCSVRPARNSSLRRDILDLFLSDVEEDKITITDPVSIDELHRLQREVKKVIVPDIIKDLYEELVSSYIKKVPSTPYISDRRYCQAMRLIQASILLASDGESFENPSPDNVAVAKLAIVRENSKEHLMAMDEAVAATVGNYEKICKEEPDIKAYETKAAERIKMYDDDMPAAKKQQLLEKLSQFLDRATQLPAEQQFSVPNFQERFRRVIEKVTSLKDEIAKDLGV